MKMTTKLFLLFCFPLFAFLFLPCKCINKNNNNTNSHNNFSRSSSGGGNGVKGMFVFGSSLVDNGNNNYLQNKAKADYLPYGVDFPNGSSGRFTNGKNLIDLLGDHLHLPSFIPPFADPLTRGKAIIHGVNFASGGSGILDDTGSSLGNVYSLNDQIKNFKHTTLPELEAQMGSRNSVLLSKYVFVIGVGGNDYTFNYFKPSLNLTIVLGKRFANHLANSLAHHLKKLYSLGGRKFVLMSVYPIGCTPMAKSFRPVNKGCIQKLNRAVLLFNDRTKKMVDAVKKEMPGSTLVYVNQYKIIWDILVNPAAYGFKNARTTCCNVGSIVAGGNGVSCRRDKVWACRDRSSHFYFDGLHPTEAANIIIANKAFNSQLQDEVYPINVSQLAKVIL